MLLCYFIAGHLVLSNGEMAVPFDKVDHVRGGRGTVTVVTTRGVSFEAEVPEGVSHDVELLACSVNAEENVMSSLGGADE